MNSLAVRKSILRSRAVEFSRLLMLSMLEDANDTFSAMLTVLSSELGQCNLSVDQFLQVFGDMIKELRTKMNKRDEAEATTSTIEELPQPATVQTPSNSKSQEIEIMHVEKVPITNQETTELVQFNSLMTEQTVRFCKNCRRYLSAAVRKPFYKGYCNICYHKSKRFQQLKEFIPLDQSNCQSATRLKQMGCRQCVDCLKIVPKGGVFYRSARLCKNCYERHRLMLRRTAQKHCSGCNKISASKLVNGKCTSCLFESEQRDIQASGSDTNNPLNVPESNEICEQQRESNNEFGHWFGSIESNLDGTNAQESSFFNQCQTCKKANAELDANGICQACHNSTHAVKNESADSHFEFKGNHF